MEKQQTLESCVWYWFQSSQKLVQSPAAASSHPIIPLNIPGICTQTKCHRERHRHQAGKRDVTSDSLSHAVPWMMTLHLHSPPPSDTQSDTKTNEWHCLILNGLNAGLSLRTQTFCSQTWKQNLKLKLYRQTRLSWLNFTECVAAS